jgi:hypothetical protein
MILPVPNNQTLPVIRITVVLTGDADTPRWTLRDNGGDFHTHTFTGNERDLMRQLVEIEARRRMSYYCSLGYAVEPWSIPS